MDIQKEREAFEAWLYSIEKFKFRNKLFLFMVDENGVYEDAPVLEHWKTWQAAKADVVSDGFVLVPKEPTKDTIIEMASVCLLPRCKNGDVEYLNLDEAKEVYQAAIKAQEPASD